jgi:hypothetical protein
VLDVCDDNGVSLFTEKIFAAAADDTEDAADTEATGGADTAGLFVLD